MSIVNPSPRRPARPSKKAKAASPTKGGPRAKKPAAKKPAEGKPAARKPAQAKPAARKPAARKPAAKKPAGKNQAATRSPGTKAPSKNAPPRSRIPLAAKIVLPLLVVVGAVGCVWAIDERSHTDRVPRNVWFAGSDISGASQAEVSAVVANLNQRFSSLPVEIAAADITLSSTAATLGLQLDTTATVEEIMAMDRNANPMQRFTTWIRRFSTRSTAEAIVILDAAKAEQAVADLDASTRTEPTYPSIELTDGAFVGTPGEPGRRLNTDTLLEGLEAEIPADPGGSILIATDLIEVEPPLDGDALAAHVGELNRLTAAPLQVLAGADLRNAPSDLLRSWLTIVPAPDGISAPLTGINAEAVDAWLREEFPPPQATFDPNRISVVGGVPRAVGSSVQACCGDGAPQIILEALLASAGRADLPLTTTETNPLAAYGIVELIGEFTTYHPAGQDRVTNIQRMADLARGAIIEPGDPLSINDHVGRRTPEKGFVEAGVIYRGVLDTDVGGGVSQFATTLFNAAFFAGLDFDEYQAHSIYFERYPYGREATISFPAPDLQIRNTTPYPVLVWTSYTADSITVSLYSTIYASVQESGAWTEAVGACTKAITQRTRTFPDKDPIVDTVAALYQPKEGLDCAGLPTIPVPQCQPNERAVDTTDTGFADTCEPLSPGELAALPGAGEAFGCAQGQAGVDSDGNGVVDQCIGGTPEVPSDPCAPLVSIDSTGDGIIDSCGAPPPDVTSGG